LPGFGAMPDFASTRRTTSIAVTLRTVTECNSGAQRNQAVQFVAMLAGPARHYAATQIDADDGRPLPCGLFRSRSGDRTRSSCFLC
jgi:hypothetical protein